MDTDHETSEERTKVTERSWIAEQAALIDLEDGFDS